MRAETGVYDSSRWTGISETDEEPDDSWLPEEIVPHLSSLRVLLHLIGSTVYFLFCSILPFGAVLLAFDLDIIKNFFPDNSKEYILDNFGIVIIAASFLFFFYVFILRYLRHIARYKRMDYIIRINRVGIFTKDTGQLFQWGDVIDVSVVSHALFPVSSITISREAAKRYNRKSIWTPVETHTWCLDGTDVDFYQLERSTKRWHELAHKQPNGDAQA